MNRTSWIPGHAARRARARIRSASLDADAPLTAVPSPTVREETSLEAWLSRAGYRDPSAPWVFQMATFVCIAAGVVVIYALFRTEVFQTAARWILETPGDLGYLFLPIVWLAPVLILVLFSMIPTALVRARRRRVVLAVEQDLPITLELFSTLAESGLGFDAALEQILASEGDRPLATELRTFQVELLAGVPRIQAFQNFGRRLSIPAVSTFVSALVQAEQVGAGIARVLRQQVEDLRLRRREQALARAQSLPAKLAFPLVLCFLPSIFVLTLGPAFFSFFDATDSFIQGPR